MAQSETRTLDPRKNWEKHRKVEVKSNRRSNTLDHLTRNRYQTLYAWVKQGGATSGQIVTCAKRRET